MKRLAYLVGTAAAAGLWAYALPAAADPADSRPASQQAAATDDEYQGLPPGNGRDEVFGLCGACHSLRLVTQQGLSRQRWSDVLVYMVEEQEMPELDAEMEKLILDYLAEFYGPDRRARGMAR